MAQHASPNVAGQMLFRRAHLTTSSSVPVRKLWSRLARPCSLVLTRGVLLSTFETDAADGGVERPGLVDPEPATALDGSPVESALRHEPRERDHERNRELGDDPERVATEMAVRHRPREQEDDLDVEDDEDHRHQVEANREARRWLASRHDAALVG